MTNSIVHALGPGEACIFNLRSGAPYEISALGLSYKGVYGHVAWGFEVDNSGNYIYGSDDGPSGGDGTPKKWNQSNGTRSDMMNWFKNQNYDYYNCENVPNSAVGAAANMIATVKTQPYYVFLAINADNCLTDTINILTAYNAPGLPIITEPSSFIPNYYFDYLPSNGNPIGGQWSLNPIKCC
ncbi:23644_t:CDS:1 [Gigaspora margarita]|uniref:23644_t:CDS:1 n=1 Tax=Gigaspora margarita TaxID=4874 RepID=A0ABN7UNC2_GIGMA|nr:23644_t:CDS:1 [Gigaspora margarita]